MRAFGADVVHHPESRGHHADAHPADAGARGRDRRRDRRLPDRPVQQHRHDRRLPGARAASCSSSSMADRRDLPLRRDGGLLPGRHPCASRATPGGPSGRRRAGRVRGPVGRPSGHPPDRGRRRRVPAADARASTRSTRSSPVSTADAFAMARRAARDDGVWSGPSTGANIAARSRLARRLGEGARVATAQVDSGLKYLAGELYT